MKKQLNSIKEQYQPTEEDLATQFQSMTTLDSFKMSSPFPLSTVPDLIVALKAFYQATNFNSSIPFSKWIATHASKQGLYTKFRTSKTSVSLQKRFKTNIETFEHQIAHKQS